MKVGLKSLGLVMGLLGGLAAGAQEMPTPATALLVLAKKDRALAIVDRLR